MAQIPDYTALGPRPTPTPSYRRPFVDESGEEIASSMEGAGRTLQQAGDQLYAHQVNFARAQASNALLDHEISVRNTTEQIREDVASGKLSWDQAPQTYQDQVDKLQTPNIANLDPVGQENFERGMKRNVEGGSLQVTTIARAGQKQAFADQFQAAQDKLGKLAGMPGADIENLNSQLEGYRPMALEAGVPKPVVDKSIQDFKDRNWFNQATQRSMEAKDNMASLQELEHDLTDKDGYYAGKLDTDKRNAVLRTVINDRLILENRIQHEADKREAKAARTIGQIDEQISSGIPATPSMWDNWESTIKGTTFEQDFEARQHDEQTVQDVLRRPIDQQVNYVQQQAADLEKNGGTLRDRANLVRLQTAVNQNVNLLQKAPLLFAANRNGTEPAAIEWAGLNTPDGQQQIGATISDRMTTLQAMQKQYGSAVQQLPLLPQEAGALTSQLQDATPPQRAQLLVTLRGAFKDDAAYEAAMRQIAPHSPVTAIAGAMVGRNAPAQTPAWFSPDFAPKIADVERVLRGEALLNPASAGKAAAAEQESGKGALKGGMPMPPDEGAAGLRGVFGRAAGDMFRDRPQLADAYYSVFKDAYASLLAEKGDMKGLGDPKLQQQALNIALGNRASFGGQAYSVPAGMDPSRFEGYVETAVGATAKQLQASDKWMSGIRGYGLREIGGLGSGRYVLTNGNLAIARPDGQGPFTIDLRNQYLPGHAPPDRFGGGPSQRDLADSADRQFSQVTNSMRAR